MTDVLVWPSTACWVLQTPMASGPRSRRADVIASTAPRSAVMSLVKLIQPAMPHMCAPSGGRRLPGDRQLVGAVDLHVGAHAHGVGGNGESQLRQPLDQAAEGDPHLHPGQLLPEA